MGVHEKQKNPEILQATHVVISNADFDLTSMYIENQCRCSALVFNEK